jgi:hypothetical protein
MPLKFLSLNIVLKDTPIVKKPTSQLVTLVKPIDTTSEQHVDDLTTRVKHVVIDD